MAERLSTGFVDALNVTGSVKSIMTNFTIHIYSGTQPATADAAETGDRLMKLTLNGGAFTSGAATNGLNFHTVSTAGVLPKATGETWSGSGETAAGAGTVAGYFRAYANTVVTGISTTGVRFDGAIGTSSTYEMQMSNTTIVSGVAATVNSFSYTNVKQ